MNDDTSPASGACRDVTPSPTLDSILSARPTSPAGDSDAEAPPVWFLDVDGVLNIDTDAPLDGTEAVELVVRGWPVTIRYRPAVVSRINALHSSGLLEVVWLTTWRQDAVDVLSPTIGLDRFSVADEPSGGPSLAAHPGNALGLTWWKSAASQAHLKQRRRSEFIWTDDELALGRAEVDSWAPSRTLLLPTDPLVGLTAAELDSIEAFAHGLDRRPL